MLNLIAHVVPGGDGGLEGLGGPSVLLGSPDKKKCKSQVQ